MQSTITLLLLTVVLLAVADAAIHDKLPYLTYTARFERLAAAECFVNTDECPTGNVVKIRNYQFDPFTQRCVRHYTACTSRRNGQFNSIASCIAGCRRRQGVSVYECAPWSSEQIKQNCHYVSRVRNSAFRDQTFAWMYNPETDTCVRMDITTCVANTGVFKSLRACTMCTAGKVNSDSVAEFGLNLVLV